MASIHYNPHLPGELARVILRRIGDRQFYVKPAQPSSRPPSPRAVLARRRFAEAIACGKQVIANPARRAPYAVEPLEPGQRVFNRVVTDFLQRPVIRAIDLSRYHGQIGDEISIQTREGLDVFQVLVALRRADDTPVETNLAVLEAGAFRYRATQAVPTGTRLFADVTVTDVDGLVVRRSVPLVVD